MLVPCGNFKTFRCITIEKPFSLLFPFSSQHKHTHTHISWSFGSSYEAHKTRLLPRHVYGLLVLSSVSYSNTCPFLHIRVRYVGQRSVYESESRIYSWQAQTSCLAGLAFTKFEQSLKSGRNIVLGSWANFNGVVFFSWFITIERVFVWKLNFFCVYIPLSNGIDRFSRWQAECQIHSNLFLSRWKKDKQDCFTVLIQRHLIWAAIYNNDKVYPNPGGNDTLGNEGSREKLLAEICLFI